MVLKLNLNDQLYWSVSFNQQLKRRQVKSQNTICDCRFDTTYLNEKVFFKGKGLGLVDIWTFGGGGSTSTDLS